MTNFDRFRSAVFLGLALTLLGYAPAVHAQSALAEPETQQDLLDESQQELLDGNFSLDPEIILGEEKESEKERPSMSEKSTDSDDLDFLDLGESPATVEQLKAMQKHVAEMYEQVEPAVVNIKSGLGQGSGVVVTSDGYILTAAHVIAVPNRKATITFPDGSRAMAQTLGLMRTLDAGLLKIYEVLPDEDAEVEEPDENAEEDKEEKDADQKGSKEKEESSKEDAESPKEKPTAEEDSEEGSKAESSKEETSDEDDDPETSDQQSGDKESESEKQSADEEKVEDEEKAEDEDEDEEKAENKNEDEEAKPAKKEKEDPFKVQEDLPSFPYLDIADSSQLNLGQWVLAVGHPGGLDEDRGIVLRVGRINSIEAEADNAYLRTDCTLVGGDSGGPLIGMDGSVIGIHSRIGQRLSQNFHVPSNDFVNNWSDLLVPVVHDRDADLSVSFRGKTNVLSEVPKRSLAARSGLKTSDRIIRVGDQEVYDKLQFDDAISKLKPYQVVELEIQRRGKKQVIEVTMGEKQGSK